QRCRNGLGDRRLDSSAALSGGKIATGTDIAEHMRLIVDRLVRPGPAQPGGPVGGQRQQRQVPVRGLEHGRVEVGHGRSRRDRKSTRLNSSHVSISYAVFCLKKKKKENMI